MHQLQSNPLGSSSHVFHHLIHFRVFDHTKQHSIILVVCGCHKSIGLLLSLLRLQWQRAHDRKFGRRPFPAVSYSSNLFHNSFSFKFMG